MKTQALILLLGGGLLMPSPTQAQSIPVSLDEALRTALQNNIGLKAVALEVDFQKQFKRAATEIPKTNMLLTYGQYNTLNKDNNVTIIQSLPFPTVFTSQSKLGEMRIQSSEYRRSSSENDLLYQVKQVYLTLHFLFAREKLLTRQDSIFADLVRITSLQYKTGEAKLLQKTTAETRYNEVQNLKRQNLADQKVYENQLQILMNVVQPVTVESSPLIPLSTSLVDDSSQIRNNPQLAYHRSIAAVAQQEKRVDANKAMPDISVGYFNQTLIGFQQQVGGTERYFSSNDRFSGFMAGIAFPLWFVPTHARIKSSSIRAQSAHLSAEYFERQLQGEWSKAVQEFRKNKVSIDYFKASALPNAQLILHQSQLAYKAGEISQAEYRLNLQQALSIEEGYLQSVLQYNQSIILLEFLSGTSFKK